jgi:DNA-binding NarL/FixJ family response regulator
MSDQKRLVLADRHTLLREGLRSLLEKNNKYNIVGEAADGQAAIKRVEELRPDMIILDVNLADSDGLAVTRQTKLFDPNIKVLAISHFEDYGHVAGMIRAGSSGYLLKECHFEEALKAIETILAGGTYYCQKVTRLLLDKGLNAEGQVTQLSKISQDSVEIIRMLANGKSAGQIATELSMSVKTIEAKRRQIMRQLRINNLSELVKVAISEGLVSTEINSRDL